MAPASSFPPALLLAAMIGLAAVPTPLTAASPSPLRIEIFTTAAHPVEVTPDIASDAVIQVHRLDAPDALAADLGRDLPADPTLALQVARQRFQATQSAAATRDAIAGLQRATQLGVRRYPAIVFDARQIVYGVTDLPTALALYQGRLPASR